MDSDTRIQVLKGMIATKSKELQALQDIVVVAEEGYKSDQVRIDQTIQADSDARSQHITELESKVAEHETVIETLTSEKTDLQGKVESLMKTTQDSKEALTTVVTTISDALEQALPADAPVAE